MHEIVGEVAIELGALDSNGMTLKEAVALGLLCRCKNWLDDMLLVGYHRGCVCIIIIVVLTGPLKVITAHPSIAHPAAIGSKTVAKRLWLLSVRAESSRVMGLVDSLLLVWVVVVTAYPGLIFRIS